MTCPDEKQTNKNKKQKQNKNKQTNKNKNKQTKNDLLYTLA